MYLIIWKEGEQSGSVFLDFTELFRLAEVTRKLWGLQKRINAAG